MPNEGKYYAPDCIDCNSQATALGEDFAVICEVSLRFERDQVVVIASCRRSAEAPNGAVVVQAIVRKPLRSRPDIAVMAFSAMQDCWHQLDRGVLSARPPAVAHGWSGRPQVARRDKRS